MATVADSTTSRKPKAFYSVLFDESGALTKVGGMLYFISEAGAITEVEPSMVNFLVVLGEMQMSDAQRLDDLMHGDCAAIACSRQMEVQ
jgi:hypothetical protein